MKVTRKEMKNLNDAAFALFAKIHPHETYKEFPRRFLKFARIMTGLKNSEIIKLLKQTNRRGFE